MRVWGRDIWKPRSGNNNVENKEQGQCQDNADSLLQIIKKYDNQVKIEDFVNLDDWNFVNMKTPILHYKYG